MVERVIGERINETTGRRHFLLKWQGYSSEDDTWEPESNLVRFFGRIFLFHLHHFSLLPFYF